MAAAALVPTHHWFYSLFQSTPSRRRVLPHRQLNLLTLPVRRKAELQEHSQRILKRRPDLAPALVPVLLQRLHTFSRGSRKPQHHPAPDRKLLRPAGGVGEGRGVVRAGPGGKKARATFIDASINSLLL